MDQLPCTILHNILTKADAKDCARIACVDRRWRQCADDDALWKGYCLNDFILSSAADHCGNAFSSYREAYASWHKHMSRYSRSLVRRAKRSWDTIKDWLRINFREVLDTLVPGVTWKDIERAEQELGFSLPDTVRLLYQICNGQEGATFKDNNFPGVLGGYHVYDHFVNVQLLPLEQMVMLTNTIVPRLYPEHDKRRILIATSCNFKKFFFVDCDDGLVYVGTRYLQDDAEMMPCVPLQEPGAFPKDGMLRWLEYYGCCLQNGSFSVRDDDSGFRSISLFPRKEPFCTEAITHGLQVKCSAVFVPEMSRVVVEGKDDDDENYVFAYSVRMRLLEEGNRYCGRLMTSAQLTGRHWIIRDNDVIKGEVRGQAVIGQYPCLKAGGDEFVYESQSAQRGKTGSMSGDFTFVPGRLGKPEGGHFAAYVAQFPLKVPDYIF